jgi:large subunit ribosomal protein L10
MAKQLKQIIVDEMAQQFGTLDRCVVVNFSGVSALGSEAIRRKLREQKITMKVVKNSLMARAFAQAGLEKLVGLLEGPCAVVAGGEDIVSLAKAVSELADKNKQFVIRGGYGEGLVLGTKEVRRFAAIPPRPVLVAQFLSAAQGPVRGFVGALAGVPRQFVCALDAVAKKQAAAEPVAPAVPAA